MMLFISGSGFRAGDLSATIGDTPSTVAKVITPNVACVQFEGNLVVGTHDLTLKSSGGTTTFTSSITITDPVSPAVRLDQGLVALRQIMMAVIFSMCIVERDGILEMDAAQAFEDLDDAFDKIKPALSVIEREAHRAFKSFVEDTSGFLSPDQGAELKDLSKFYIRVTTAEKRATLIRANHVNVVVDDKLRGNEGLNERFEWSEPVLLTIEEEADLALLFTLLDTASSPSGYQGEELALLSFSDRSATANSGYMAVSLDGDGDGKKKKPWTPKPQEFWLKKVGHKNPGKAECKNKRKYYVFMGDVHDLNAEAEAKSAKKLIKFFQKKDKNACVFLVAGKAATEKKLVEILKDPTTDGLGYTGHGGLDPLVGIDLMDPSKNAGKVTGIPTDRVTPTDILVKVPRLKKKPLKCAIFLACFSKVSDGFSNDWGSVLTGGQKNFFGFKEGCTTLQGVRVLDEMLKKCDLSGVEEEDAFEEGLRKTRAFTTRIHETARELWRKIAG
ncbi:hypothetical protein JYT15_00025 [Acidimicrobium ferrooxidans]|nr:hypothetical protein [Acidimicrobium ferrooxidans]